MTLSGVPYISETHASISYLFLCNSFVLKLCCSHKLICGRAGSPLWTWVRVPVTTLSPHPKLPWHRVSSTTLSGSIGMWMRTACAVNTKLSARTTMWCCVAGKVGPPLCSGLCLNSGLWRCKSLEEPGMGPIPARLSRLLAGKTWGYQSQVGERYLRMEYDQIFLPRLYLYLQGPV